MDRDFNNAKQMRIALLLCMLALDASACDLLIKAVDATHTNAIKDARGCYKRGDIVSIDRDGFYTGSAYQIPPKDGGKFVRIRICKNDGSELLPSELRDIIISKWPEIQDVISPAFTNSTEVIRRRILRVTLDLFTTAQKTTLNNVGTLGFTENGQAAITLMMARSKIENKLTGETP